MDVTKAATMPTNEPVNEIPAHTLDENNALQSPPPFQPQWYQCCSRHGHQWEAVVLWRLHEPDETAAPAVAAAARVVMSVAIAAPSPNTSRTTSVATVPIARKYKKYKRN